MAVMLPGQLRPRRRPSYQVPAPAAWKPPQAQSVQGRPTQVIPATQGIQTANVNQMLRTGGRNDDSYIWKPGTDKGPVFLAPDVEERGGVPVITLADGTRHEGRYYNTNEGRHQYVFDNDVLNQEGATLNYNDVEQAIGITNNEYEGHGGDQWDERPRKGSDPSGGGGGGSGQGGYGAGVLGSHETTVVQTPGAPGGTPNNVVIPGGYDFESIQFDAVEWQDAYDKAVAAGDKAKQQHLQNIKDSQQSGLDLVNTDIKGITAGLDALVPRARAEGDADTQTNIGRAGQIDQFNAHRISGINSSNRTETGATNDFNRGEFEEAVDSTGVNYRDRIDSVLNDLKTQSTGKFSDELLDTLASSQRRGRGADLAASAGVGGLSGAGINAQDKIDAESRIEMALQSQARIPGVAGQAQQLLQPPLEFAKSQILTPTGVPLNPSTIGDRTPIQANISAGSTALSVANTATNLQAIPATTALSTNINTQQFNSQGQMNRDQFVANAVQNQILGQANALQGGYNADKGDQVRNENFAQNEEGRETANRNQNIQAGTNLAGSVLGATPGIITALGGGNDGTTGNGSGVTVGNGSGGGSNGSGVSVGQGTASDSGGVDFGSNDSGSYTSDISPTISSPDSPIDQTTGISVGGVESPGGDYPLPDDPVMSDGGGADFGGSASYERSNTPMQLAGPVGLSGSSYNSSAPTSTYTPVSPDGSGGFTPFSGNSADVGAPQFQASGGNVQVGTKSLSESDYRTTLTNADRRISGKSITPLSATPTGIGTSDPNTPLGAQPAPTGSPTGYAGATTLAGPFKDAIRSGYSAGKGSIVDKESLAASGQVTTSWGKLSPSERVSGSASLGTNILQNKDILTPQEAKAINTVGSQLAVLSDPAASSTNKAAAFGVIKSQNAGREFTGTVDKPTSIAGKAVTGRTDTGFTLSDGSTVSKQTIQAGADTTAALHAYQVLATNAPEDKKLATLAAIGVSPTNAQRLVKETDAGNSLAPLSLFNTQTPWNEQTDVQKAAAVIQTTGAIHGELAKALPSNKQSTPGARAFRGFQVSGSGASYGNVSVGQAGPGQSGIRYNTSLSGHDIAIDPVTGSVTSDFYGWGVTANNQGVGITSGPRVHVGSNSLGASVGAGGVRGHATGSVNDSTHVSVTGNVGVSGSASVKPTIQIGNSPQAQQGASYGGTAGGYLGSFFGPYGAAVGSFLGSALGSAGADKFFGGQSGQDVRTGYRGGLVKNGFATNENGTQFLTLANGTKYDIGQDGGATFKNKDGSDRFSYEVDWTDPLAADSIPAAHLVAIATGLDPSFTKRDSFNRVAGQLTNAITSNAGSMKDSYGNAKAIIGDKVKPEQLGMRIEALRITNKISEQEYGVYLNTMNNVFGTSFKPVDRDKSMQNMRSLLGSNKDLSKEDKKFFESLDDTEGLADNLKNTERRTASVKTTDTGGLPTPDRYQGTVTTQAPRPTYGIQQAI